MTASHRVGRILRRYRLEHHLSQEAMADLCEISTRHYCDLENGCTNPKLDTVERVFDALHLSFCLLDRSGHPLDGRGDLICISHRSVR